MKFSKEKENNIINMYYSGKTQKEIAIYYNTFNTSIRRVLLRNNIKIRSNSEIQSFVNNSIFDTLTSWEVNYWLGWLISDGCIYKNRITLQVQEKDLEIIKNFKKFLGNKIIIKTIIHSKFKTKGYRIDFKNKTVFNKLQYYGITERKSLTISLKIPLTFPMLLGIFEGDGTFVFLGKNKDLAGFKILSGSEKLVNQLYQFLVFEGFNPTITKSNYTKNELYSINLYRKKELIKLYTKLYNNAPYFLKRKEEKFGSFVEKSIK